MDFSIGNMFENELGAGDTHRIAYMPMNRLLAESSGRGWQNLYAALASVNTWSGTLESTGHPCLAYCLHRPAHLQRKLKHTGRIERRTIRPREFFILPAYEGMEWQRHGSSDMLMLYLRQDLIDALAKAAASEASDGIALELAFGTSDPLMEQIALSILRAVQTPDDGTSGLYVDGLVHALILHLLRRHAGAANFTEFDKIADTSAIRHLPEFIDAHLSQEMTVAMLAAQAGLTPQALARSFQKYFGTTVHQYVLSRRLDRARQLLLSSDIAVVDIAIDTGFSSQSHLSTAFKRLTGLTPGQYRSGCL